MHFDVSRPTDADVIASLCRFLSMIPRLYILSFIDRWSGLFRKQYQRNRRIQVNNGIQTHNPYIFIVDFDFS